MYTDSDKPKIIETYKGVDIIKSCGYFYPAVNGNVECKDIKEVRRWIREVWLFCVESMKFINPHC
jgi:hypothetical protein